MNAVVTAYIALGANIGDAAHTIRKAVAAIDTLPESGVVKTSGLYRTAPLETLPGHAPGGDYINAVVKLETLLPAPILLRHLQQLESAAGRERPYLHAPRTLDLDLLLYGSGRIDSPDLTVPHPRMWSRGFVLMPLHEIAPELVGSDALQQVARQAIARLPDALPLMATASIKL